MLESLLIVLGVHPLWRYFKECVDSMAAELLFQMKEVFFSASSLSVTSVANSVLVCLFSFAGRTGWCIWLEVNNSKRLWLAVSPTFVMVTLVLAVCIQHWKSTLRITHSLLTTAPCVSFVLSSGKKIEKGRKKIKEGWTWNWGVCFVVDIGKPTNGFNSIFSCIAGQETVCSCLCPARSVRVNVLHGCKVSLKCPKNVRTFFPSCSRKNFGVPAAYHAHRVTFMELCSLWFCGGGTALVQVFYKGFRDPFPSVCVFWLSIGWALIVRVWFES